mgnify:CR=1 FL=1
MAIKYADTIINEIKERGPIITSETSVNGEEFEKWLYGEDIAEYCFVTKERMICPITTENEYAEFYGDAA